MKGFPLLFYGPFSTAPPVYGADLLEISSQLILVKSFDTSDGSFFPILPRYKIRKEVGAPEGRRIYGLLMGVSSQIGIKFASRLLDSFNQLFLIIGCKNLEIPPLPPPDHTSFCHGGPQSHFWSFLTSPPPPPISPPSHANQKANIGNKQIDVL